MVMRRMSGHVAVDVDDAAGGPRQMALRPRGPSEAQEPLLRVDARSLRGGQNSWGRRAQHPR